MTSPATPLSAFISHSSPDDGYVAELEQFVRALGYDDVFNDVRSIAPDARFWPEIEQGIAARDTLIVVITPASMKSEWVLKEVDFADGLNKNVVPIWIEDCELPARFADRDVIDFRPGSRVKDRQIAPSRILRHSPPILFGREKWLEALDAAWNDRHLNLYTLVAWGGVGKTSLVAHWVAERFAKRGWPGVERYFDWSFYSQGTGESRQTSADLFISEALKFFGDRDPTVGGAWERGERLANLIRQNRTLLVLDGIEPLQYPPNDKAGMAGRLKDQGLEALIQGLAADNPGLCIVTSREHLKNVEALSTTEEKKLDQLLKEAAVALLRHLQIVGTEEELEAAWRDAGGHALTLQLLGRFIADAYPHDRDICHYREVKLAEADEARQGRSAFKVMIAYEKWLASAGPERLRELAILRLTGLFDRPISAGCLEALRAEPVIAGLTDALVGSKETQWNLALARLVEIDLLSRSGTGVEMAIDAHPLVREYFAEQLERQSPEAFREAHSRLFDHLCETTPYRPDDLPGLAPLYQAVVHGCLAGRRHEACTAVYQQRILRGIRVGDFYSASKLGALGADLAAVTAFFELPWKRLAPAIDGDLQAWLLHQAAFKLRSLGRLTEALEPLRISIETSIRNGQWLQASARVGDLSKIDVALGKVDVAVANARRAVELADLSEDTYAKLAARSVLANALHQDGRTQEALEWIEAAEQLQATLSPALPLLFAQNGFVNSELILVPVERAAWQRLLRGKNLHPTDVTEARKQSNLVTTCDAAERRSDSILAFARSQRSLVGAALDSLSHARVQLYRYLLLADIRPAIDQVKSEIADALAKLRQSNAFHYLPRPLLTSALFFAGLADQLDKACRYLDEAQQIAERGPMPLYLADVHLHRARLFRDKGELASARHLVEKLGYWRRKEELEDAEALI